MADDHVFSVGKDLPTDTLIILSFTLGDKISILIRKIIQKTLMKTVLDAGGTLFVH